MKASAKGLSALSTKCASYKPEVLSTCDPTSLVPKETDGLVPDGRAGA